MGPDYKQIVLEAMKKDPSMIRHVDKSLLEDKDFMQTFFNSFQSINRIEWPLHPDLMKDEEFAKGVIAQHGYMLQRATMAMRDNEEIVTLAIKSWGGALDFASCRLRSSKHLMMLSLSNNLSLAESTISKYFKDDRQVLLKSSEKFECLDLFSNSAKHDFDLTLKIVSRLGGEIRYVHSDFKVRSTINP